MCDMQATTSFRNGGAGLIAWLKVSRWVSTPRKMQAGMEVLEECDQKLRIQMNAYPEEQEMS